MEKEIFELENSYCQNIDELLKSSDFRRAFKIALEADEKYDTNYFLSILDKINKDEILEKQEKIDFENLLNDGEFKNIWDKIIKKMKWFTIDESVKFLKKYSTQRIFYKLIEKTKRYLIEILWGAKVEKVKVFKKNIRIVLYKDIKNKYCVKKTKNEHNIKDEDFIFDKIQYYWEINWDVYYIAKKDNKEWYIKLWEEEKLEESVIFDEIYSIEEINWELYYIAKKDNKEWYIKLWEEDKWKENIIFDEIYRRYKAKLWAIHWTINLSDKTFSYEKFIGLSPTIISFENIRNQKFN